MQFLGRLRNEEIPTVLARSAAYVMPSEWEGHPKALIEAMASGTPVIGADRPGIRNVITDGETGLVCEPTERGLRDALIRLLAEPRLRARLGESVG